jgi:SH3 domain-containing protein
MAATIENSGGFIMRKLIAVLILTISLTPAAHATSGPGCLIVTNVAYDDALNMRSRPSASARIVDQLVPGQHGIIHLDAPCTPPSLPWAQRWCRVSHYNADEVTHGWVKARYVRDSDCP